MAKKKPAGAAAANGDDPNAQLEAQFGEELLRYGGTIVVPESARVDFRFHYLGSPGLMVVRLNQAGPTAPVAPPLMKQAVPPPPSPVDLLLPVAAGTWVLSWAFAPTAKPFQTVAEVVVNGIVRFRHFKTDQSDFPFPTGYLYLEVV